MATLIFPSVNDVNGGVAGQGKTLTEANLRKRAPLPYFDKPYVKSGAAGSNAGGLNLNVALGVYCIEGYYVEKTATESVLLTASSTNRVWLQLVKDGSGNVTGTSWVVRTDATVPSGEPAALTHIVVTGASTITTITDSFRGIIQPGGLIGIVRRTSLYTATITATNLGAELFSDVNFTGDGRTSVEAQCAMPSAYLDVAANAVLLIRDNGSTDVGAGFENLSTSGGPAHIRADASMVADASVHSFNAQFYNPTGASRGYTSSSGSTSPAVLRVFWGV